MPLQSCNVLLIYPNFDDPSFWEFKPLYGVLNKQSMQPPLGLLTVAALLPPEWTPRVIDRNTDTVSDSDLAWADLVFTGGMIPQRPDTLRIIELAHRHGKPVVVGGPDVSTSPEFFSKADFRVLGEAETVIDDLVSAWDSGHREGQFEAIRYETDVTRTPLPRYDLINVDNYVVLGIQFSRGCPFTCEFCDIIEIYGRVPRAKTIEQMIAELDALLATGYRGTVLLVDDNLIGNKKAIKAFLPHLKTWLEKHGYPFDFATEASLNVADDTELLALMRDTNFGLIFVGIESSDEDILVSAGKKQNTRRDMIESANRIYAAGLHIAGGFMIGFDTEKLSVSKGMNQAIREMTIPIVTISLLTALPKTQLWNRLIGENRLDPDNENWEGEKFGSFQADDFASGLNFKTLRDRRDILKDYREVLAGAYDKGAYFDRTRKLVQLIKRPVLPVKIHPYLVLKDLRTLIGVIFYVIFRRPDLVPGFVRIIWECLITDPKVLKPIFSIMMGYIHLGPFAKSIIEDVDRHIDRLDIQADELRSAPRN